MATIQQAIALLHQGRLVAFPTETVYGLGADATNPSAVQRIFAAKGRPSTNPLIVHVANASIAQRYTTDWPPIANALANHFWPGPLTLVLPKSSAICDAVTAGRMNVGIRVPSHPLALQLLNAFDGPVAAPSANRANHISPTSADAVRAELGDQVDLILDGGACAVGIESTVIDLSQDLPMILRPGGVTRQQIESVIGPVNVFEGSVDPHRPAASPGQQVRHYSPLTPTFRFNSAELEKVLRQNQVIAIIIIGPTDLSSVPAKVIVMPDEPQAYARLLYHTLREADDIHPAAIHVEMPPDLPAWAAVRDRLLRATVDGHY